MSLIILLCQRRFFPTPLYEWFLVFAKMDEFSEDHINLIYSFSRYMLYFIIYYILCVFFCYSASDFVARKFQLFEANQCRIFFEQARQSLSSELFKRSILKHEAMAIGFVNISWY